MRDDGVVANWDRIRRDRKAEGLSQQELADMAGVSLRTVSNAENGRQISLASLKMIANALNKKVSWKEFLEPAAEEESISAGEVFLVENYHARYIIRPVEPLPQSVRHGQVERLVVTDNVAEISDEVTFSRKNRCMKPFRLSYGTHGGGFVGNIKSDFDNAAEVRDIAVYEDFGTHLNYCILPECGRTYRLSFTVMKGFDCDNRRLHHHVGSLPVFYQRYRLTLDLTGYLECGFQVVRQPSLQRYEQDLTHTRLSGEHAIAKEIEIVVLRPGSYYWELRNVRGGVLECSWDVALVRET